MKDILKRAGWIFLAALFVVTGLGVGLVAFWQATHPANNNSSQTQTSQAPHCGSDPSLQFNAPTSGAKLAGAKLASFTPTAHIPAISCIDAKVGSTGKAVQYSSTIVANYTGAVAATGVIFQSSLDNSGQPFTAQLNSTDPSKGLIQGWDLDLLGMRAGGERRLLIPAALAYGANPPSGSGIPANADLVFDITVLAVQ